MRLGLILATMLAAHGAWAAESPDLGESMCLSGTVVESNDVDAYTYLRLSTGGGETWAAIDRTAVPTGTEVAITQATVMKDFWSRTLDKTFDWIVFGRLAQSCGSDVHADAGIAFHHAAASAQAVGTPVNLARADGPNGRTVAEVVAGSATLGDQPVAVRGQVVRYTSGVMGKNWIHLRDGSGTASNGSDDILVVTDGEAGIGEVVLVKGVVRTNRDFGAGYAYKVLIDDARLER